MHTARLKLPAIVLILGLGFWGCGGGDSKSDSGTGTKSTGSDKTLDMDAVTAKIEAAQKEKTPDLEVGTATCPDDVAAEKGATFECTIDIAGVTALFRVTVTEASGEAGSFDVKPAKPIIGVAKAVELIRSNLDPSAGDVQIDCGDAAVKVLDVGATFPCTLTSGADTQTVNVLVKDAEGTVSIST